MARHRGITPAFGYSAPHPGAGGTSTLLNNALLSAHYGTVRLLQHVRVRRSVHGLRGPALLTRPRRTGDLPVLVHVVSQRARVLRLRRTGQPLAFNAAAVLPSSISEGSRHPDPSAFRSSIARPTGTSGLRFRGQLTLPPARLEARMESLFSFPVGLLHPLQHAGCRVRQWRGPGFE
jgi:hypothetical protein